MWDPRAVQKEALSFSITAVATTMVVGLSLSGARGQCEADAECVRGRDEEKERWRRESETGTKRLCGELSV